MSLRFHRYLTWGEPLAAVDEKLRWMDRLIERVDDEMIRKVQAGLKQSESEGQRAAAS